MLFSVGQDMPKNRVLVSYQKKILLMLLPDCGSDWRLERLREQLKSI